LGARGRKQRKGHHHSHHAGPIAVHKLAPATEAAAAPAVSVAVPGDGLSLEELKAEVQKRQIRWHIKVKHRTYCANVPDSELAPIEKGFRMRTEAAGKCKEMLAAAREEWQTKKKEGDAKAQATRTIELHSAYRNIAEDTASWNKSFGQYYARTASDRNAFPDGPHGPKAIALMVVMMRKYKAAPGYSNHSNGLAVDFRTVYKGDILIAASAQKPLWIETWLHPWLVKNAPRFGYQALNTEEWHWDYVGVEAAAASAPRSGA
jgi:hypothetical protein